MFIQRLHSVYYSLYFLGGFFWFLVYFILLEFRCQRNGAGPYGSCHPPPHPPTIFSACLLPVENFIQRISLIREVRNAERKENSVSSVQSLSRVRLFATPWTAACQASLFITNSRSLLKFMSIELVMPSNHLILCHPLLLLSSIFPRIRVFSNESVLHIRWPKYWSFSFNISPSNEYSELISFRMDWLDLLVIQGTLKNLKTLNRD